MPHFLNPGLLYWALFVVPAAALLVLLSYWRRRAFFGQYADRNRAPHVVRGLPGWRVLAKGLLSCLMLGALLIAAARPAVDDGVVEFPRGELDVIAIVDVSRSMAALDYDKDLPNPNPHERGTRLDMARQMIFTRLMPNLRGNHLGIVTYAGEANPQAPLSDDLKTLSWLLQKAITVSSATGEGSCMAKAISLAFALFDIDSPPTNQRVIVLFSDGGNDDGEAELSAVAAECRKRGIAVVVVGLGSKTLSPIPVAELNPDDEVAAGLKRNGKKFYETNGEVEKSAINETTLQQLATKSGGRYLHLTKAENLDIVSQARTKTVTKITGKKELFAYPLMAAAACCLLLLLVPREFRTWRRKPV